MIPSNLGLNNLGIVSLIRVMCLILVEAEFGSTDSTVLSVKNRAEYNVGKAFALATKSKSLG